jgi:hypothetical protein
MMEFKIDSATSYGSFNVAGQPVDGEQLRATRLDRCAEAMTSLRLSSVAVAESSVAETPQEFAAEAGATWIEETDPAVR